MCYSTADDLGRFEDNKTIKLEVKHPLSQTVAGTGQPT